MKRGRPALSPSEPSTDVHLTMPDSLYDRVYAEASTARVSVPELIRRTLNEKLETQNRP